MSQFINLTASEASGVSILVWSCIVSPELFLEQFIPGLPQAACPML